LYSPISFGVTFGFQPLYVCRDSSALYFNVKILFESTIFIPFGLSTVSCVSLFQFSSFFIAKLDREGNGVQFQVPFINQWEDLGHLRDFIYLYSSFNYLNFKTWLDSWTCVILGWLFFSVTSENLEKLWVTLTFIYQWHSWVTHFMVHRLIYETLCWVQSLT